MIRVIEVKKIFTDGENGRVVRALDNVNLFVGENEFVCVVGQSGSGKTTLLNLIAGFEMPTSGRIFFQNREVKGPGTDRGVVFQQPTLFPWLTALENVEFGLRNLGMPLPERTEKAARFLRLVGLETFSCARPHELSVGMQQRVAIARVLAMDPEVLLMDEPFGALDAITREQLQDELLEILALHKKTVVFVTHSVEEAVYLGDRIVVLGRPPGSVRCEMTIPFCRPRSRSSTEVRDFSETVRRKLAHGRTEEGGPSASVVKIIPDKRYEE